MVEIVMSVEEARRRAEGFGWKPRNCVWELTLACNLQCLHCISIGSPTVSSFYELYKLYELNKPDLSKRGNLFFLSSHPWRERVRVRGISIVIWILIFIWHLSFVI